MVSIKEVESLNKRIEKINQDYTKKKTQQDMLYDRLNKEIKAYKDEFEVDLSGNSLAEIKSKINTEHKKVVSAVEEAYAEKLRIVSAIEEGDYEEAAALLGIVAETVDTEESEEGITETETETQESGVDAMSISFDDSEEETGEAESEDEEDLFGFGNIDEGDPSEETSATEDEGTEEDAEDDEVSIPGIDEDDEVEDVGIGGFLDALKGSTIEEAIKDVEKPAEDTKSSDEEVSFGGFTVDDSDDEGEEDFGFGDLLSGTKFGEE